MKERYQNIRLGFTVVELLVVIVVIAVLASITVVAYRSVQKNAAESTVKADLSNAAKKLVIAKAKTGCPADATSLPKSDQTTYSNFSCSGQNFCIQAKSNKQATVSDYYINQDGKVTQGQCSSGSGSGNPPVEALPVAPATLTGSRSMCTADPVYTMDDTVYVNLSWQASVSSNVTKYRVYETSSGVSSLQSEVPSGTLTFSGRAGNWGHGVSRTVSFYVVAVNASNGESGQSPTWQSNVPSSEC